MLSFLVIACTEEGMKYLATRLYAYRKIQFNEPFDGITYCVIVSMGFATLENLFYVLQHGYLTGIMRMFLSVPAHASFGVLMGYHLGLAKIDRARQWTHKFRALLYPVVLHGLFDFFLFLQSSGFTKSEIGDSLLIMGSMTSLYIGIRLSFRAIALHKEISRKQFPLEGKSQ
jgi:protease PrsW